MPRTRTQAAEARDAECDAAEAVLCAAAERAMKSFLSRLRAEAGIALAQYGVGKSLLAAALPNVPFDLFTSQEVMGWWEESVNEHLMAEIAEVWRGQYLTETTVATGFDDLPAYLASVKDRLVPGVGPMLSPSIPEDAFNMARGVITRALATGDSPAELARQLAATFSWDQDQAYWEGVKAQADAEIDAILDAIGPPGDPAREAAKLSDPVVLALRQDRNLATSKIDAVQSTWQARATRIARTESTGALNAATLSAMYQEGVQKIEWVATNDSRTRPSHRQADGQVTPLGTPFNVGGYPMRMPGDPSAPARLVVNCRCTIVAVEDDAPVSVVPEVETEIS